MAIICTQLTELSDMKLKGVELKEKSRQIFNYLGDFNTHLQVTGNKI